MVTKTQMAIELKVYKYEPTENRLLAWDFCWTWEKDHSNTNANYLYLSTTALTVSINGVPTVCADAEHGKEMGSKTAVT